MTDKLTEELEQKIRDEFVHGVVDETGERRFPTVEGLAKTHNVSRATLYRRSSDKNWQMQKNQYQSELEQKLDAERLSRMVGENRRLDDSCVQISVGIINSAGRKLQRTLEMERDNPLFQGINTSELSHLANAVAMAQKIGKLALGQAQEISKVSADVTQPEAFREAMEQLDELAANRASQDSGNIH